MPLRPVARWTTWDEPDADRAVAQWVERDICVVFPLLWAKRHGQRLMIARAKDRIAEIEQATGRTLVPGCVLLAFSRDVGRPTEETPNPDVSPNILGG